MHGKGIWLILEIGRLYYDDGKLAYDGEFSNGKMNNFGIQYNRNPTPIEGSFDFNDFG